MRVRVSDSRQLPPTGCARNVGAALSVHFTQAARLTNCAVGHVLATGLAVGFSGGGGGGLRSTFTAVFDSALVSIPDTAPHID